MAVNGVYPDRRLVIGHSMSNALYFELIEPSGKPLS
jgi:hypothetical protein